MGVLPQAYVYDACVPMPRYLTPYLACKGMAQGYSRVRNLSSCPSCLLYCTTKHTRQTCRPVQQMLQCVSACSQQQPPRHYKQRLWGRIQRAAALQHPKVTARKPVPGNPSLLVSPPEYAMHGQRSLAKKHILGGNSTANQGCRAQGLCAAAAKEGTVVHSDCSTPVRVCGYCGHVHMQLQSCPGGTHDYCQID
jgi:hypothetical protein